MHIECYIQRESMYVPPIASRLAKQIRNLLYRMWWKITLGDVVLLVFQHSASIAKDVHKRILCGHLVWMLLHAYQLISGRLSYFHFWLPIIVWVPISSGIPPYGVLLITILYLWWFGWLGVVRERERHWLHDQTYTAVNLVLLQRYFVRVFIAGGRIYARFLHMFWILQHIEIACGIYCAGASKLHSLFLPASQYACACAILNFH